MTTTMKDKEAAFVKHQVRQLWDEMWIKDGRMALVFDSLTFLRNGGEINGLRLAQLTRDEFKVSLDTASAMVASWLAHTRGEYPVEAL